MREGGDLDGRGRVDHKGDMASNRCCSSFEKLEVTISCKPKHVQIIFLIREIQISIQKTSL